MEVPKNLPIKDTPIDTKEMYSKQLSKNFEVE